MTKDNSKTNILRKAMIASLALLIAVPVFCMNHEQNVVSDIDNRKLQDFPTLSSDMAPSRQIEHYFSDRIGFRKEMIGAFSVLNDKAFHLMVHPLYEYGTDGYVYFGYSDESYDDALVEAFADYIKELQVYYTERSIPFLYVISPEKARVYPEHIPTSVGDIPFSTDKLKPLLDDRNVNYIDLGDALLDAKSEGRQVFNPIYDAGHWNSEGMYAGSEMIINRLREMGIDVAPIDISDYKKDYTEQTTLKASFYPIHETTFVYNINPECDYASTEHSEIMNEVEMSDSYNTAYYYTAPLPQQPDVLMYQGSYFNTQGTILQNEFRSLATIHDYENVCFAPYYTDIFQPDVVIFENADYTVTETYYPYELLVRTKLPPVLSSYNAYQSILVSDKTILLDIDTETTVSTITSTWPTQESIDYLYVIVDDVVYDTIPMQNNNFKWGAMTDVLSHANSIEFIGVSESTHTKYHITCL